MLTVQYINFSEGGLPVPHSVEAGTRVADFIRNITGSSMENFSVKVNRRVADGTQVLNNGDTVAVAPRKVDGGLA